MSEPAGLTSGWRPSLRTLAARGEAVALRSDRENTTYAQLAGRAEAIANALLDAGTQTGDHVALLSAGRGHDEAAGLLGVILAGGVVVPLHHGAPRAQIAKVIKAANCRAIVHDEKSADHVRNIGAPDPPLRIELDDEGFVLASLGVVADAIGPPSPGVACILYTSGSTGVPKAVPLRWEGIDAFTSWMMKITQLGPRDRVLRVAELSFNLAWFDHLAAFRSGSTLLTMSRRQLSTARSIADQVRLLAPTVVYSVPSFFMKLCAGWPKHEGLPNELHTICFAGDIFPPSDLLALAHRAPSARLFNLFGPTETNVCTFHEVDRSSLDGQRETPIGTPTPYADCRLVDPSDPKIIIEGEGTGELIVRGPTVLEGECPTRDRVKRAKDGLFYFRGRLDRMVKIRGYRVDPSEVEAALCAHPRVRRAAVLANEHPRLGIQLTAFVAADNEADPQSIRAHLTEHLPSYMAPQRLVLRTELPLTKNGNVDYGALHQST